jgi:hypothetical protein
MLDPASDNRPGVAGDRLTPESIERTRRNDPQASTPASTPEPGPREPRFARIARRAHQIYTARGGQHGKAMDDWLQAEREIDKEIEDERPATAT